MADKHYFERDKKGQPVKFVQYHDSHPHKGENPHTHTLDMKKVTIGDISKGGKANDKRK